MCKADWTAPDKIGISMEGNPGAIDTSFVVGALEKEPSMPVHLVES